MSSTTYSGFRVLITPNTAALLEPLRVETPTLGLL
jgi:hypothetical protein